MSKSTDDTEKDRNEQLSILLQSKAMDWRALRAILCLGENFPTASTTATTLSDSLCRQALSKACLDPTVCPHALSTLLYKTNRGMCTLDKVKLILKSVRCNNTTACRALSEMEDGRMLTWRDARGNTILHLACAEYGWNPAIAFLFGATMHNFPDSRGHHGLFNSNGKGQCPLWLSLEAGSDIKEILNHLKQTHPLYVRSNIIQLTQVTAEYCEDMTGLQQLVQDDPTLLDGGNGGLLPLHFAAFYQNCNMMRFLLLHYQQRGCKRRKLLKRLMTGTTRRGNSDDDAPIEAKAPLACLVLGVGRSDPGNSIECIQACHNILGNFPLLHYAIDEVLWPDGGNSVSPSFNTRQCLQTVTRIVDHWQVDLLSLDDEKRRVTSLLIAKQPLASRYSGQVEKSIRAVLGFVMARSPRAAAARDRRKRLPLHLACEAGWEWNEDIETGYDNEQLLAQLVRANPSALEEIDPKLKVFPCALATDLTTIYNLLRFQPGIVCRYCI